MLLLVIRGLLSVWLSTWEQVFNNMLKAQGVKDAVITDHGNGVCWFCHVQEMFNQCVAAHKRGEKIVLVGHSFGATSVLMLTRSLDQKGIVVDFAGPIDPAYQYDTSISANVHKGLSFYQRTPGQLGQGIVHPDHTWPKGEFDKAFTVKRRYETHLQIAADPVVLGAMTKEVVQCLKS